MTGWAILGTGQVSERFAAGLRQLGPAARIVATASRDPANARAFAARHGGQAVDDYAAALALPGVEAAYVATPPALHEAHALLAIAAGRAVLVEKPFASDAAAAARIRDAARAAGVFCMEAMWTRFLPMIAEAQARLAAGALGEIRALEASFMASDRPDPGASLFDAARGGGSLLHRGIYAVSLARMLLGPATLAAAAGRIGATGVDEDCTLVLRHQGGALSTLRASLRAPGPNRLVISGTHGQLVLDAPLFRPFRARITPATPRGGGSGGGRTGGGRLAALRDSALLQRAQQAIPAALRDRLEKTRVIARPYAGNGYHYEAAELADCLAAGRGESARMPLDDSVEILALIDAARAAIAEGQA
jgi:predicted dehydrogenase